MVLFSIEISKRNPQLLLNLLNTFALPIALNIDHLIDPATKEVCTIAIKRVLEEVTKHNSIKELEGLLVSFTCKLLLNTAN
jgi:hypothetical protein